MGNKYPINTFKMFSVLSSFHYLPGPAVPYAPCGPPPAIHSRAGAEALLDHLQRCATTFPAHTPRRAASREGGQMFFHLYLEIYIPRTDKRGRT